MANIKTIEGDFSVGSANFALVVSRFNSFIVDHLVSGAVDALQKHGVPDKDITVIKAPGAYELPLVTKQAIENGGFDAVIALGAVIRGGTPHFEYVASEVNRGLGRVTLDADLPVIQGIITADNLEQAIQRAGTKEGNKGFAAAVIAIEMANLLKTIP